MTQTVDAVALTQELVRFNTINPPGNEAACAHHLGDLLAQYGFTVSYCRLAEGREGLIARLGGQGPALAFTGHLDTVPLGAADWQHDPFAATIHDGRLYGRGSTDMKAGVAAFCAAAIECRDDIAAGPGIELVITASEETGSQGAREMAQREDGLGDVGALVVAEPTSNTPTCGHKGALWMKAICTGITAHGSMPEHGVNAAYKAGRALQALAAFTHDVEPHPVMGAATLNVGTVSAGMNLNSVPDRAEIGIDVRSIVGMEHSAIRQKVVSALGADCDSIEVLVDLPSVWTDPENAWVKRSAEAVAALTGTPSAPRSASYFTDASILTPAYGHVPTLVLGPGDASLAHQTDESCEVDQITTAVAIYRRLILDWQLASNG
ncbi:M20 family metallopeptidase [Rhodovibrio salinarum]|uniref:Probable succinyl-diaminopimelate desuccinylase n=1 Tax=Rhodovibrio salinarum TaxID=1087 RepID=A0A934V0R5_9PROT|nr:M20 family metallopeptidase [Rhodovibrio salinarum]MBK1698218.1 acetylornithine deacetylase [Rhodovibrio salinarum]